MRVLEETLPKAYLLENVPGLKFSGKSEGLDYIAKRIAEINQRQGTDYSLDVNELNAADYGVPQLRRRVPVVGARDGTSYQFPSPTHTNLESLSSDLKSLDGHIPYLAVGMPCGT